MRRLLTALALVLFLAPPVQAMDLAAPAAPDTVSQLAPEAADSFPEGLWRVIRWAAAELSPSLREAGQSCARIGGILLLCGLTGQFTRGAASRTVELGGVAAVAAALLEPTRSLLALGAETVTELAEYGKLLMPVMASCLAARGGATASAGLYVGTAVLDAVLSKVLSALLLPMLWVCLAMSVAASAAELPVLRRFENAVYKLCGGLLKTVLWIFTGYMTLTGVVSGATDAMTLRAAKMAISGAVPVVGGILSDAAEAVLVSAGTISNGAGIYGIVTVLALFAAPFVRLGVQYLMLKAAAALGETIGGAAARTVEGFARVLGLMLAMTGTQTVLLLVSCVCFLKGVG